jgi:hypothetical protein
MSSADITQSSYDPNFLDLKKARKNLDIGWKEVEQFLEDINERFYALEANTVSEVEKIINSSAWLLPTSTLSKSDFDLLNANDHDKDIDRLFLEKLMTRKRIKETLSTWKKEPFVNDRYPILEQAVKAHLTKKFYLSVSTLMPQIEGLLRDVLGDQKELDPESQEEIKKAIKSLDKTHMKKATRILTNAWNDQIPKLLKSQAVMLESLPDLIGNLYKKYEPETGGKLVKDF